MALIRSNVAWVQGGKQSAKGTPPAEGNVGYPWRTRLASDDRLSPRAETAVFAETDGARDAANSEKVTGGAEGSFGFGVRDSFFHKIAEMVIGTGSLGTTGTTNYVHTIQSTQASPINTLDYYSIQQMLGNTLWERFSDMVANEFTLSVEAGGFMTATVGMIGRTPLRLTSAPSGGTQPTEAADAVYQFNDAAVSIGGAGTGLIRSMNLTITNNVQLLQTDDVVPYDVSIGSREVTLGFDMLFEDIAAYNTFHYGTTVGTTQSATTAVTDLNFLFTKGANNSIEIDFDAVNYEEFPVAPDTGGEPIIVNARVRARRNASGLVKFIVKNQTAT